MLAPWKKWNATPPALKALLLESAVVLAVARLLVAFGFRWIAPWLLRPEGKQKPPAPEVLARSIGLAVRIASRSVPWSSVCLPNAIAAKMMLARRGYASTIHLGVGRKEDNVLHAHAWLQAGGVIVTGKNGMEAVVALPQQPQ